MRAHRESRVGGAWAVGLLLTFACACASGTPLQPPTTRADPCNGRDDDGDGRIDEDAACRPGAVEACGVGGRRACSSACLLSECEGSCIPGESVPCGRCGTLTCEDGRWGECEQQGDCAPGSERSCSAGTESCSRSCRWDPCLDPRCAPGDIAPCGNCGQRTCGVDGWGVCEGEGECAPGSSGACGIGGSRSCELSCSWGMCEGEGSCRPGDERPCGSCGFQTCGEDFAWSACAGGGVCNLGDVRSCGEGGLETCDMTCRWGSCLGEGSCSSGQTRACGRCGTQRCTSGDTWSDCEGTGPCVPGEVASCGLGGTQTCGGSCMWGRCEGEGECTPGASESCGRCGVRTCGSDNRFGPCGAEGECVPARVEACSGGGSRTCSAVCTWSMCDSGECTPSETESCGNCGTRTCDAVGRWSVCAGSGPCAPGVLTECGVRGLRECTASCEFATCSTQTHGLRFDGDYVRMPASTAFDFGTRPFTIELWMRADPTQPGILPVLVSGRVLSDLEWVGWWIGLHNNPRSGPLGVVFVGNGNGLVLSGSGRDLRDATWHHVAVTHQAGNITVVVDGAVAANLLLPESFDGPGPIEIGGDPEFGPEYDFAGSLFDIRIWNFARTVADIREDMVIPRSRTGMVGAFPFDEGTGQVVRDSVRSVTGTLGASTASESVDPSWLLLP